MNKRLNKKLHKKYLNDVVYDISVSKLWRKEIFNLASDQSLVINRNSVPPLPSYIKRYFHRFNLQYTVRIIEKCPNECLDIFEEGLVVFEFVAKEYPQIKDYSVNNPDVI